MSTQFPARMSLPVITNDDPKAATVHTHELTATTSSSSSPFPSPTKQPTAEDVTNLPDSFSTLPPFPTDVPTAPLLRLSLSKLLSRDQEEITRFNRACEDLGFFYLDLTSTELGDTILADADKLFPLGEKLFELPVEELIKYDFIPQKSYFGYKGYGAQVTDRKGTRDRNEFYNVSKDDILEIGKQWPAPEVLATNRPLMKSFMVGAHKIVTMVLELLNDHLNLPAGTLPNMHRQSNNSGDQIRFVKAPPQPKDDSKVALGEHTDFGSVTVLFNRLGGLQVLPPGEGAEWCYVKPLPGHAIVNLGDAMVKFTNGVLRSNIHRVVAPPGEQATHTRYSLVYFNRPQNGVILKRLEGSDKIPPLAEGEVEEQISSEDWVIRRALKPRIAMRETGLFDYDGSRGTETKSRRTKLSI